MQLEVHTLPSIYRFKKAKQSIKSMIEISQFIHVYLQDGGDPRQIHKACPDLDLKSSAGVTTKITNGSKEIQRTNIPVYFGKEDSDEKV
tara:strand:- start:456 stop:722 length:267 start_codon:yes stop_codon:yes gene_type:complete